MLERDLRSELAKGGEVEIDRPDADCAAAGKRDANRAGAREQRSQDEDRGPHGLHELVGGVGGKDFGDRDRNRFRLRLDPGADVTEDLLHRADVGDPRKVRQAHGLSRQESRREAGQGGVLRAGDGDFSFESRRAVDDELVHGVVLEPAGGVRGKSRG